MGIVVYGSTSEEPLTTFLLWTMRCVQEIVCNFSLFLFKFGCHGIMATPLAPLKIYIAHLKSPTPKNPTIHAKNSVDIM